jgi:hypothetical protein
LAVINSMFTTLFFHKLALPLLLKYQKVVIKCQ